MRRELHRLASGYLCESSTSAVSGKRVSQYDAKTKAHEC